MYRLKKIAVRVSRYYALDLRALSLLRIGIALIVIADLIIRASDLKAHYTDEGIWQTKFIYTFGWKQGFWSFHALSGSTSFELMLFALHGLFALSLLLGYKTKWSTVLVWLFTVSLHNRNVFILQAGDDVLRLILFWGIFLPWNACYSIDTKRNQVNTKQNTIANLAYLLLLASVYFFTAILKTSPEWRSEGTAVYYALSLEQLRLPVGDWLYQFPNVLKILTHLVFYIELLLPFLILFPSKKGYLRLTAFLLILVLHIGIGFTLYVGLFFVISMVSALGLLPKFVLDKVEKFLLKPKTLRTNAAKPLSFGEGFGVRLLCIIVIILSITINLSSTTWFQYELKKQFQIPINALRLNQYWGMFSPEIMKNDGWLVYYGIDEQGRQWDLRTNKDYVDFSKPAHIVSMYKTDRWRKLAENMANESFTFLRPMYGKYMLDTWNKEHPEKKLVTLNMYYMEKINLPDYKTSEPVKKLYCVSQ